MSFEQKDDDELAFYPEGCYVAVTGSVARGFKFWGPFKTMKETIEWIENKQPLIGYVTVVEVQSPSEFLWRGCNSEIGC